MGGARGRNAPARIRAALARARVPGRLEALRGHPTVILDVAHNAVAARTIATAISGEHRRRRRGRLVLLFAAAREKPARAMLRTLARVTDAAVLCRVPHPRMRPLDDLLAQARGLWKAPPIGAASPEEGLSLAAAFAGANGTILITGSFYLAGGLRQAVAGRGGTRA